MARAAIVVLDSFGIGATPDAGRFGDDGADTFGSIARQRAAAGRPLKLPNLARYGLLEAAEAASGQRAPVAADDVRPAALYGYAAERSSGKDTPSGHWEMAGLPVLFDWGYFTERENTFPAPLLEALIRRAELPGVLGNCHASGTEIIARLGEEHMLSGKPIVYTSADSVFQ
ncbi:MAG: phosphopentomutase, partial [Pseudomonadota bacterium]